MARPRKENRAALRSKHVGFYATPDEQAELDRRAALAGRPRSEFCRIVLLSDIKAPIPTSRDGAAVREFTVALNRIGNNVNQLAHAYNERRETPEAKELAEISERLWLLYQKAMEL